MTTDISTPLFMDHTLALEAIKHWNVDETTLTFIAQRENKVYRVNDALTGNAYALRLHRPGLRLDSELISECQWLQALHADGQGVPMPVASLTNDWCVEINGHWVDMQTWLPGDSIANNALPQHYRALGQAMAKLHTFSDNWTKSSNFQRPQWDIYGFLGETPEWGRFWDNPALNENQKILLNTFRTAASNELTRMHDSLDFGLIHADMVSENVLVENSNIHLIDFDDSGFGYRLFELATVILRLQRNSDWEVLLEAIVDGYRKERTLDIAELNLFLAIRACTYIGWIMPRLSEPHGAERGERFIRTGCLHVERWLTEKGHTTTSKY